MVTIRLSRFGRKKAAYYRISVVDSRKKATSGTIEYIGTWNPIKKVRQIDKDRLKYWVSEGAQVSPAVKKILEK